MTTDTSPTPTDDSLSIQSTSGPPAGRPARPPADVDALVEDAVRLARRWEAAGDGGAGVSAKERSATARLASLVHDPAGVDFALGFVDKVARPEDDAAAARELRVLARGEMPAFLGPVDRALVAAGGIMAPKMPGVVVPASRRRLRQLVGHLVVQVGGVGGDRVLAKRLAETRAEGVQLNLNLLGEAVLGEEEAARRRERTAELLRRPDVDYVSVKATSVLAQLAPWDHEASLERLLENLLPLYRIAMGKAKPAFINLDMEEYKDLDLTVTLFERLCATREIADLEIGIVLQAYLPDSLGALERVRAAALARRAAGGAKVKVRLVKGANLAMEAVDAELHHWPQAPYTSKPQVDANYVRLLDRALDPAACEAVRVGVASHNLFHVALAHLLSVERGVADAVDVEALQGMAPAQTRAMGAQVGGVVLYTPVVHVDDFDVAVSYLVRRLEENASPEGFLYSLFAEGDDPLAGQELAFRASVAEREDVAAGPRRTQDVAAAETAAAEAALDDPYDGDVDGAGSQDAGADDVLAFVPEPDVDPSLTANRTWARRALAADPGPALTRVVTVPESVDAAVAAATRAGREWAGVDAAERARALLAVGDALAAHRGALLSVMVHEAGKTIAEADPEISEAIDFARYYATRALALEEVPGAVFTPAGVVVVTPPWNFPVAIMVGGALAALAAGAAAIVKPAPQVVRCAEVALAIVTDALAEAGAPARLLQLLRTDEEAAGRRLVTHPDVDVVVLTGASDTAALFTSWRPDLRLLAETSGKNSLVITPSGDVDLAVADLVRSAFGHAGQKCSAASLGIVVGSVARSPRFRRQLVDAVTSLVVGPGTDPSTTVGPLVEPASGKLLAALTTLEPGESWLVQPRRLDETGRLWSPGVKEGVRPGSTTHMTEFFGPVLGIMAARDLDEAISWQNASGYGLTGGLHSLEEAEIDRWLEGVAVGCAYVNRHITGAVVQRQPFGGWGRSVHGPGAKAGGPGYVMQMGAWADADDVVEAVAASSATADPGAGGTGAVEPSAEARAVLAAAAARTDEAGAAWLRAAATSDALAWRDEFSVEHDPTGLLVESNVLRYRPLPSITVRAGSDASVTALARVLLVAAAAGVRVDASVAGGRDDLLALASGAGLRDITGTGVRTAGAGAVAGSLVAEDDVEAARRVAVGAAGWDGGSRLRLLGTSAGLAEAAAAAGVSLLPAEPVAAGRVEGMTVLREQTVSRTRHRFGHVEDRAPSVR